MFSKEAAFRVDGSATEVSLLLTRVLWIVERPNETLDPSRFELTIAGNALEGLKRLECQEFEVVVASFPLPDWSSEAALLEELQRAQPSTPIVIQSPDANVADVVRLMHLGAFHVLQCGDATTVVNLASRSRSLRQADGSEPWRKILVGESQAMQKVAEIIRLVASRRSTVLITGETGTGKEMVARAIHAAGNRSQMRMVSVNCTAFPETLLEAELFGHVKGAFTGATNNRVGRFEQAHRGTIFLDEIGDMPLNLQAKLLRVIQERELQRLGSSETIHVDARVIASTNVDLEKRIQDGKFREDLFYRLNVVPICIPPLRERRSDIALLALHFIEKVCAQEGIALKQISPETLRRLALRDWPGNVRELENAVEKAAVLSGDRASLCPGDFTFPQRNRVIPIQAAAQPFIAVPETGLDFERTVGTIERDILEQALRITRGNKKLAAEILQLKRTTLSAKLKSLTAVAAAG
jgi:DNA-binding NtrC family response regulator